VSVSVGARYSQNRLKRWIEMQEKKREAEKLRAENGGERVIGRQSETEADLERTLVEPFLYKTPTNQYQHQQRDKA
jgi:hypothetical protein